MRRSSGSAGTSPIRPMPDDEESPGVPGFHSWGRVYLLVFAAFILMVIGLAILSRVYA